MKYDEVAVSWASNGRPIPTAEEQERMVMAIVLSATVIASRFENAEDLEDAIPCEIIASANKYGWEEADAKRVLRDACIQIH